MSAGEEFYKPYTRKECDLPVKLKLGPALIWELSHGFLPVQGELKRVVPPMVKEAREDASFTLMLYADRTGDSIRTIPLSASDLDRTQWDRLEDYLVNHSRHMPYLPYQLWQLLFPFVRIPLKFNPTQNELAHLTPTQMRTWKGLFLPYD